MEPQGGVLIFVHGHQHVARDLGARPGHLPQVGPLGALTKEALEGGLARVGRAPVIAERLHVGLPDHPPVLGCDGAHLKPGRQCGQGLDLVRDGAREQEEMALGPEACLFEGGAGPRFAIRAPGREPAGPVGGVTGGQLATASERPSQERQGHHVLVQARCERQCHLEFEGPAGVVAPLDPHVGHRLIPPLDQHEVGPRVAVRAVGQADVHVGRTLTGRFAGGDIAGVGDRCQRRRIRLEVRGEPGAQAAGAGEAREGRRRVAHVSRHA